MNEAKYIETIEVGVLNFKVYTEKNESENLNEITFVSEYDKDSFMNFSNSSGYIEHINGTFSTNLVDHIIEEFNIELDNIDIFNDIYYRGMVQYI